MDKVAAIAENIERLATIELSRLAYTRGVVQRLYEASVESQGPLPLLTIGKRLVAAVRPDDVVVIVTGAGGGDAMPFGENDGPLGAASLAVAVKFGLGATPLVLTEAAFMMVLRAATHAFGLWPSDIATARKMHHHVALDVYPTDDTASAFAQAVMDLNPAAVICVEKKGVNSVGVPHSATGRQSTAARAPAEHLVELARSRGIYTVGIGDNGNEIGFGLIVDAVRKFKPYGSKCQCPCGSGLATVNATDGLVVANISNWGAYALTAVVALLTQHYELVHDGDAEGRALELCMRAGAADGRTGRPLFAEDGVPGRLNAHFVDMLRYMVRFAESEQTERPF